MDCKLGETHESLKRLVKLFALDDTRRECELRARGSGFWIPSGWPLPSWAAGDQGYCAAGSVARSRKKFLMNSKIGKTHATVKSLVTYCALDDARQ